MSYFFKGILMIGTGFGVYAFRKFAFFRSSESGAATTDWAVLAAAAILMSAIALSALRTGTTDVMQEVNGHLNSATVQPLGAIGWTAD